MTTLPTLWADVGFNPNAAQEQAILHIDGPLYLPAGPGSGKTCVLLWRVVNLIVYHGVKPDEIFLATLTEKAALQLKEGLRGLLPSPAVTSRHTGQHYDLGGIYVDIVNEIKQVLADHLAENLSFVAAETAAEHHLEDLYPPVQVFIRAKFQEADRALYDWIQLDSGVESCFLQRLKADPKIVFFFKFPANFKIALPKQIGNYNPDWGLVRYDHGDQKAQLYLIRETKGGNDLATLRFPHEKRKIICAMKYFAELGVDYNFTSGEGNWWASRMLQERLEQQAGEE